MYTAVRSSDAILITIFVKNFDGKIIILFYTLYLIVYTN